MNQPEEEQQYHNNEIAIIGMSGRFPGARNLEEFWDNLKKGVESISLLSDKQLRESGITPEILNAPNYLKVNGTVSDIDMFDANFFQYSPKEAIEIDPQQRFFLECAWEAIESSGYNPENYEGSIGVYAGSAMPSYLMSNLGGLDFLLLDHHSFTQMLGNDKDYLATRVAYKLNLTGPALNVQTACSTSLVAVHLACQSLLYGECDMALAGGVSIQIPQNVGYLHQEGSISSQDGHCRAFDARSTGTVYGNGVGVVLLKPLQDAIGDGDCIHAVIKGSAINNDGFLKQSYTAPSVNGQAAVISEAQAVADVSPETITYIEAHGTGTKLGDPIEIEALTKAFSEHTDKKQFCAIGSLKTNVGHMNTAAGVGALIKTVLALKHNLIPPSLHYEKPNPQINFSDSPFYVNNTLSEWKHNGTPLRAGVSSFGVGGTNAHVIIEEAPSQVKSQNVIERPIHLLTLSAKTEKALEDLVSNYQNYLETNPELELADVCYTASTGRSHFNHRLGVIASEPTELIDKLLGWKTQSGLVGVFSGQPNSESLKIAFLFTGQGSQYINMGRQLYEQAPTFRQALEQCDQILQPYLETSLLEIIYPKDVQKSSLLDQTAYTQPAIFALEYALFKLWDSWGIKPNVVMGHSVGEYVAACIAGVFSLEDGLKLIAMRGQLMQKLPSGGEMVSVMASESQVTEAIKKYTSQVTIAAVNGPESIVISGESGAITSICAILESEGIKTKQLQVSHGFHSPLMEAMLTEFEAVAKQVTYNQPKIPLISNVTGTEVGAEITTAEYWVGHVRQPVRFAQSMKTLEKQGYETFLEIGPKPILLGMGRQCVTEDVGEWLPSLRPGVDEWQQMLSSLGKLYVKGVKIDWSGFDSDYSRQKVVLPTYRFQRERYWIETKKAQLLNWRKTQNQHPLLGEKLHLAGIENQDRFQSYLAEKSPSYLSDHRVFEKALFPATGYLEIAYSAAKELFSSPQVTVTDVFIVRGLILPETETKRIQTVLTRQENNNYKFEIFSTSEAEEQQKPQWTLHIQGKISTDSAPTPEAKINLEKYKSECNQVIDIKEHYKYFRNNGIDYGSSFQGIKQLWKGQGKALAEVCLSEELTTQVVDYHIHPALLDLCLQITIHTKPTKPTDKTYLPIGIEKWKLSKSPGTKRVWVIAETPSESSLISNTKLVDDEGTILAELQGLRGRETTVSELLRSLQPDINNWYYQINWQTQPLASPASKLTTQKWLILAEDTQVQLLKALEKKGHQCIQVSPGKKYQQLGPQKYQINPTSSQEFQQLLQENQGITGIVHLWGIKKLENKDNLELETILAQSCGSVLHLVQGIIKSQPAQNPQLWLITQGTQNVLSNTEVINPEYGSLWSLGQVITLEHPELKCKRIDYDPNIEPTQIAESLEAELLSQEVEDQIAIRQGQRYVARLEQKQQDEQVQPVQLKLAEYGVIDNLTWQPMQRRTPEADEIEIKVATVGLNFRDVLNALGLLKDYYAQNLGITSAEQLRFGFECAGTISAVGEEVSQWQVGDKVIATMASDGFSSFVTTKATNIIPLPEKMSFPEAATLPLTFLTAYYGLQHLALIQPGERVLIHAAAGGVGQAAVQIAQLAGAEILATASPSKWEFLKSLGIKHVMNSRTLDFSQEIMEITGGEGVDVVLNSLNGEYIPKNLEVLAPGGRFVEIGKIGIWETEQVKEKRPDVSYYPYDLGEVAQEQPGLMGQLLEELTKEWNQGRLKALPYKTFSSTEITAAFRYMQQAKHIGKVVVEMSEVSATQKSIQPEASYLITGGLGALGLVVAQWMVKEGAKHIVLMGRSGPGETAQKNIEELEAAGAKVSVLLGDVSVPEDVEEIFQQMGESLPPLKGVIHTAGVLDDGLLQNMSWQQFTKVMAPKVQGTWYLHQQTQELELDFFVCFSSIASMLGNSGQGNYAAANGFMDTLASYRRGMGLPGLSINWGAWAKGGMAARLGTQHQSRMESSGMRTIQPEEGMVALENLLSRSQSQVGVFPVNWSQFWTQVPGVEKMPLLSGLLSTKPSLPQKSGFLEQLKLVSFMEGEKILISYLQNEVARVLGIKNHLDIHKPLIEMGLDSLMSIELRHKIKNELGVDVPMTKFIEGITIAALSNQLNQQLNQSDSTDNIKENNWIEVDL
ncbi:MAG: type I polyketide synthase [Okeania sp. SIO3B5]|uniref:type I polyketide synthase n=1 Tax=Okeania sp. SIO3B5 TaxID=2607811 RepID=UPI0014001B9E|nr:type I polyketide synthase [Okeania sp. SIO3B5]NEO53143.1 type I polyketide synthase [Okeania sp. SIO3B5]